MAAITKSAEAYANELIVWFYERKKSFEANKKSFEEEKAEFNSTMERYFDALSDENGEYVLSVKGRMKNTKVKAIKVKKVCPTRISFDIPKFKSMIDKVSRKRLISKSYKVTNWPGLLQLLKDSGVDFKEFLKYVEVTEDVRTDILEDMISKCELDESVVRECASITMLPQYYRLSEK